MLPFDGRGKRMENNRDTCVVLEQVASFRARAPDTGDERIHTFPPLDVARRVELVRLLNPTRDAVGFPVTDPRALIAFRVGTCTEAREAFSRIGTVRGAAKAAFRVGRRTQTGAGGRFDPADFGMTGAKGAT